MTTIIAIVLVLVVTKLPTIVLFLTHEKARTKITISITINRHEEEEWKQHLLNQEEMDSTRDLGPKC